MSRTMRSVRAKTRGKKGLELQIKTLKSQQRALKIQLRNMGKALTAIHQDREEIVEELNELKRGGPSQTTT